MCDLQRTGRSSRIAFLITNFLFLLCAAGIPAAEPIKIGVIDALSGPAAAFGRPALMGWQMAAEEVNSTGGINGRPIVIVARDDEFDENKAKAAAQDLILQERVHFLGGTSNSSSALTVSQVAKEHSKLFMVHIARSERITGEKGHRYVFSACPNSAIEGKSGAQYAMHRKYLRWYIVGEDYEYGRSIARNFWSSLAESQPRAEKLGESWAPLKTADYSPYISDIKSKKPSAIYVAFGVSGMVRFLKQAVEAGVLEKSRLFLNLMADPVLIAELGIKHSTRTRWGARAISGFFRVLPPMPSSSRSTRRLTEKKVAQTRFLRDSRHSVATARRILS